MTNGTTKHSRHALQASRRPQAGAVLDRRRARRPYLRAGRDERMAPPCSAQEIEQMAPRFDMRNRMITRFETNQFRIESGTVIDI